MVSNQPWPAIDGQLTDIRHHTINLGPSLARKFNMKLVCLHLRSARVVGANIWIVQALMLVGVSIRAEDRRLPLKFDKRYIDADLDMALAEVTAEIVATLMGERRWPSESPFEV